MRLPQITRTPDGWLTGYACMQICQFYAEEAEWNDEDPTYWREQYQQFKRTDELGIKSWVAHPQIEAKLTEDAEIWKNSWTPWEQRHSLSRWQ